MKVQLGGGKCRNWFNRIVSWFLIASFILPYLIAPPQTVAQVNAVLHHVDPVVSQIAAQQPEQLIRIIVQKVTPDAQVEQMVMTLGGEILLDLSIINAFAATMSAQAAYQLAQDPLVRWISMDAPVISAQSEVDGKGGSTRIANTYLETLHLADISRLRLTGKGIGVAVVDSGITSDNDLPTLVQKVKFTESYTSNDNYGHGTHIAGIIAGSGADSNGKIAGIAPGVSLHSLKIADDTGKAYESTTINALQWVLNNKKTYNLRIVNLSVNSTAAGSYHNSALNAAVEILWFNGIVVVASAGNTGRNQADKISAAPANDPFVITVGASNEHRTGSRNDDSIAPFTSLGVSSDGITKPEIMAPGTGIYSVLSKKSNWGMHYPGRCGINCEYFRLSGTSMAAPMVAGVVALMLEKEPNLTPDQVKYRLINSASRSLSISYQGTSFTFPYLDASAAVTARTTASANTGLQPSQLLTTGTTPIQWSSVNWNSVNWNSVNWNSVNWNSVNWNSVNWNSTLLEDTDSEGTIVNHVGPDGEPIWETPLWPEQITPEYEIFMPALGN